MPGPARSTPKYRGIDRLAAVAALLVSLAGCATGKQHFVPLDRVSGTTVPGYAQALYGVRAPAGAQGEATLWSRGAYPTHDGSTVVHVAIGLYNTGGVPLVLDPRDVRIAELRASGDVVKDLPAAEKSLIAVAPGGRGEAVLHFVMPPGVSPGEIDAFVLAWAVRGPQGAYEQRTAFAEPEVRAHAYWPYERYPCWPYGPYDCTWGAPLPHHHVLIVPERGEGRGGRAVVEPRRR
jgi:hypothetical protein